MYKLIVFVGFSLFSLLTFGQQADKFAMLGKAGYYLGSATDAFYGGLSFEHMFWKHLGVVVGISQINGSTFPNKSGKIETRTWTKDEEFYPNYNNSGDLYYYTHNKLFTEHYDVDYSTYSALSVNIGVMVHALSNENNIIAVSLGGNYSWQLFESFYGKHYSNSEGNAIMTTSYERFAGIGFIGDVTYRRKVYKSFWAGAYLQVSPFVSEYDSSTSSIGAELSVSF